MEDHSIAWMRKRLWLPPECMGSVDVALGQAGETAGVTPVEITNVGMNTWVMTDAELINGFIPCPYDLDPDKPVGYKIAWTMSQDGSTANANTDWILLVGTEKVGGAISLPATALDTIIPTPSLYSDAAAAAVDFLLQWTGRGIKNLIGLTRAEIEAGAFLTFKLELNSALGETAVNLIGIMMDYAVMRTVGQGSHTDQPLQSDGQA